MATRSTAAASEISDEAVRAKTGRTWAEWFALLDEAGADKLTHKDIAALLVERHGISGWWAQSVTVQYERARGLREKYQTPSGYQVSIGRTFAVPVDALYHAWADDAARARWMGRDVQVTRATPSKSVRGAFPDDRTRISANFYAKGDGKSQVSLQHEKLADADAVARAKAYWNEAMQRLKAALEG